MSKNERSYLLSVALVTICFFGPATLVGACGYGKPACAVVDIAHSNCEAWVKYLGPDGKEHEEKVDKQDLLEAVQKSSARRAAAAPAGSSK